MNLTNTPCSRRKGASMYAVMGSASIQPGREDEGTEHLKSQTIPMVKQAPGVIAGYWLAPKDGRGWGIVLFETEEGARAGAQMADQDLPDFVTMD